MDYKEKYEQALKNLNKIKNANKDNKALVDFIEYKYPELKENGDEKIRNWLIDTIKQIPNDSIEWEMVSTKTINKENVVAWLEKQGKVKHTCRNCQTFQDLHQNCPYSPIYQYTDLTDAHKHLDDETHCEFWLEKQDEQKPKDEPKFKVGDYIINEYGFIMQVDGINNNKYTYHVLDDNKHQTCDIKQAEKSCHLWTIEDAKDGDVLATDSDSICIFDGTVEDGKYPFAYCGLTGHYGFEVYDRKLPFTHNNDVNPATKEQRDLLFQKMKEAGYEWDAENKELKKIEQPSTAWSENDERMCKNLLFLMEQENSISSWEGCYEWLKSLKERMKGE